MALVDEEKMAVLPSEGDGENVATEQNGEEMNDGIEQDRDEEEEELVEGRDDQEQDQSQNQGQSRSTEPEKSEERSPAHKELLTTDANLGDSMAEGETRAIESQGSAVPVQELWAETEGIIGEVEKFCAETDDADKIKRCNGIIQEIASLGKEFETAALEVESQCSEQVKDSRAKAEELAARTPTNPEIEALENERKALLNRIKDQEMAADQVEKQVSELEARVAKLEAECENTKESALQEMPLLKYSLTLYGNVSKIKWDFENADPASIAGTLVDGERGLVKAFKLPLEDRSQFEIANDLWDIIDSNEVQPAA